MTSFEEETSSAGLRTLVTSLVIDMSSTGLSTLSLVGRSSAGLSTLIVLLAPLSSVSETLSLPLLILLLSSSTLVTEVGAVFALGDCASDRSDVADSPLCL